MEEEKQVRRERYSTDEKKSLVSTNWFLEFAARVTKNKKKNKYSK